MTDTEPDDEATTTFASAMEELRTLVAQLEGDQLDVDQLAERVGRAVELVAWCRDRIDATRLEVDEVLIGLTDDGD